MKLYLDLFFTFAKVGVMTFGGGYAMLPILQREVVENKGWATEEELMDYFAEYFGIFKRAIESWEGGQRQCPKYLLDLMKYKLTKEKIIEKEEA